jgi:hypothetical protein
MSSGAPGWEDCAVRFGLMGAIRDHLDRNGDIDCWASCFFAATRWNRADVFARLVTMCEARGGFALVWRAFSHGVDLQWGDGHQHSLMHEAIRSGSAEICTHDTRHMMHATHATQLTHRFGQCALCYGTMETPIVVCC